MSLSNNSKIQYSQLELEILRQLITTHQHSEKLELKKIKDEFNKECSKRVQGFKMKSLKAIQGKINEICQIKKHFWNFKLDQLMLDCVANGMKWKNIAESKEFKQHKITSNEIKIKFQCSSRYKFLCLYRQILKTQKYPHISDVTYKLLLQQSKIKEQYEKNLIDQTQRQCLLNNVKLFRASVDDQDQKRQIRSSRTRNKVLSLVHPNTLKLLINTILKLHNLRKNKNVDVVEQLLNQNSVTKTFKQGQSTNTSPNFSNNDQCHQLNIETEEKKPQQINYQLTFSELQDFFPLEPNPRDQDVLFNDRLEQQRVEEY